MRRWFEDVDMDLNRAAMMSLFTRTMIVWSRLSLMYRIATSGVAQQSDRRWYRRRVSFNLFYFYLYHLSAEFVICSLEVLAGNLMWLMEIGGYEFSLERKCLLFYIEWR